MIRIFLNIFFTFLLLVFASPVYSEDISSNIIENYILKISSKFSKTYCNTVKFGISNDGALKFSIGETNKEFFNNKLNKFIDFELLNKNILQSLKNNCQIFDFPEYELEKLAFKN